MDRPHRLRPQPPPSVVPACCCCYRPRGCRSAGPWTCLVGEAMTTARTTGRMAGASRPSDVNAPSLPAGRCAALSIRAASLPDVLAPAHLCSPPPAFPSSFPRLDLVVQLARTTRPPILSRFCLSALARFLASRVCAPCNAVPPGPSRNGTALPKRLAGCGCLVPSGFVARFDASPPFVLAPREQRPQEDGRNISRALSPTRPTPAPLATPNRKYIRLFCGPSRRLQSAAATSTHNRQPRSASPPPPAPCAWACSCWRAAPPPAPSPFSRGARPAPAAAVMPPPEACWPASKPTTPRPPPSVATISAPR